MRRTTIFLATYLLLAGTGLEIISPAHAHAVITASSLKEKPIRAQKASTVHLGFNSAVELSLSQAFLVGEDDRREPVTLKPGKKPGQVVVELPPLEPGKYAIQYRILAADGHLSENTIQFSVGRTE